MNKNLKLFTSDLDRLAFEDSNSYERPYVSAVSGDAHFNKLIIGSINNPAIGEVNVEDGDYFDEISVQKTLVVGNYGGSMPNFLCFPFDITINELRYALGAYKLSTIRFASDFNIYCNVQSDGSLQWSGNLITGEQHEYDGNTVILAGYPIFITVNTNKQNKQAVAFTLTFRNKTISIGNSLTAVLFRNNSNWYFVGTPFKNTVNGTGLSTASQTIVVSTNGLVRSSNMQATASTCSGWIEYRGPIPSER